MWITWNRKPAFMYQQIKLQYNLKRLPRPLDHFTSSKWVKIFRNAFTLHAVPTRPESFQSACPACHLHQSNGQTCSALPSTCSVRKVRALLRSQWSASPEVCKCCQPCCQTHQHCWWGLLPHCCHVALPVGLWGLPDKKQWMLQGMTTMTVIGQPGFNSQHRMSDFTAYTLLLYGMNYKWGHTVA
jgi:hypothetical protein